MLSYLKKIKYLAAFNKLNKNFNKIDDKVRFYLYQNFLLNLKNQMDIESAKLLSVQVVNYLMGDDLNKVYNELKENIQKKFNIIKHLIEPTALQILKGNIIICELILRTLMIKSILYMCRYDKKWIKSIEFKNAEKLVLEDKNQFTNLDDINKYFAVTSKFIQKHENNKLPNNL